VIDAFVERQRETVREQALVQRLVDGDAAFEQLDPLRVVDRLRGLDRALGAELGDGVDERPRGLASRQSCCHALAHPGKLTRELRREASRATVQRQICVKMRGRDAPAPRTTVPGRAFALPTMGR
jgi:hypothetical protein